MTDDTQLSQPTVTETQDKIFVERHLFEQWFLISDSDVANTFAIRLVYV